MKPAYHFFTGPLSGCYFVQHQRYLEVESHPQGGGELVGANDLVQISRKGTFSREDAEKVLQVILRFTQEQSRIVESLIQRLQHLPEADSPPRRQLEELIHEQINSWQNKVIKLGALPKGLWLVDFDAGDGYFCWKYPETRLMFWHGYNDGFSNRVLIGERSGEICV